MKMQKVASTITKGRKRNSTRRAFNVIIVKSGDILQLNAEQRRFVLFIDLNQIVKRYNSVVNAKCNNKVMIQIKKGKESYISEVLYIPKMKSNFISLGQLLKKG
ncbi:hypothetical protein MTR_5g010110 [Medicago truncatula]|uniref:Retrovirus-related Pol polyprotein from transposon TNT 1-94-like beta-barrel domain-containing protein n=1 Tax=Medicago truncatula TaxID=3880 RepID=G7KC15_MEDTR|nr:hypothetical protein MTR_5g010110 [Medicago truncatula]